MLKILSQRVQPPVAGMDGSIDYWARPSIKEHPFHFLPRTDGRQGCLKVFIFKVFRPQVEMYKGN